MKQIVIRTSLLAALVACGVPACSAEAGDPSSGKENGSQQQQAFVAEVPARSNVLGATAWRFSLADNGGRAWAIDADGNVVADFELAQTQNEVTIVNRISGEHVLIGKDGRVIDTTVSEGSSTPSVLDSIATDIQAFRSENPNQPLDCGWDFAKMWGWCAATAGTCNHVLGWACLGMGASCANAAGDFYYNCLAS
jgi:hypothetical protein